MQSHLLRFLLNPLQRHFFIPDQRHDDLAVVGGVALFDDHVVAVLGPSRNQNQLPNRLPRFQVTVCLGDLLEGVGVNGKRLDFFGLDPAQQLVHGLVQNFGAVKQKTQVEPEHTPVTCRQAEGVEARGTGVVPQQLQAIGAAAFAGQHAVKTVHDEFSDRGQVAITLLQGVRYYSVSFALARRFRLTPFSAAFNASFLCTSGGTRTMNLPL